MHCKITETYLLIWRVFPALVPVAESINRIQLVLYDEGLGRSTQHLINYYV